MEIVPKVTLNSGYQMPLLGFGTAENCPFTKSEAAKRAILCAIKNGYRHFDTASMYQSEESLGEAIAEALHLGLIKSRNELFITSKLWCSDCHQDRVLPALKNTLQNLQLDYLDLYLIHFPLSSKRGKLEYPLQEDETYPMDFGSVWEEMEECQRVGLTKSIGVSNFSAKKIEHLLTTAKIIPAVDQVEMNPLWQQRNLREYCKTKGIVVTAYSPLGAKGAIWGSNSVMENEVLAEIAKAKGKTHAQVCLRSVFEKGVALVTRSYNEERMKQNLNIFDWNLSKEETKHIENLPQRKVFLGEGFLSPLGPFKSPEELWDGEM